jgi:hypothetical protein
MGNGGRKVLRKDLRSFFLRFLSPTLPPTFRDEPGRLATFGKQ